MCRIISTERYNACGHSVPCHLRYGLIYCSAPNGIPFKNPDPQAEPNRRPSWCCPEKSWKPVSQDTHGYCPACTEKKEKRAMRLSNRLQNGPGLGPGPGPGSCSRTRRELVEAGVAKIYSCQHSQVSMNGGKLLQGCFSPILSPDDMNMVDIHDEKGREQGEECLADTKNGGGCDDDDDGVKEGWKFSWDKRDELLLRYKASDGVCPNCRRGEEELLKQGAKNESEGLKEKSGSKKDRKPPGLFILT